MRAEMETMTMTETMMLMTTKISMIKTTKEMTMTMITI